MNFIESFNNKTILIPLLQRDYVQGGREDVIGPFLDSLLAKEQDLNYIYGYKEDGCFVPVDGQQRLTTLWLLYLYLYARKGRMEDFHARMRFSSREYAEDFCQRLTEHMADLLKNFEDDKPLDEAITDQNWMITSWKTNTTVRNMLSTLRNIHQKVSSENFDEIYRRLVEAEVPSITFAYKEMGEDNGLDDDIYIKMNGRGRKLSAFENLKSYMDEQVAGLPFADGWKDRMDNEWTDLFWANRNKQQEHPEEIDDEQLYCLYNLLILFHVGKDDLTDIVKGMEPHMYENLLAFLDCSDQDGVENVIRKIIGKLQKACNFPLVWFERLKLLSPDFLGFAFQKLNKTAELADDFNKLDLYIGTVPSDKTGKAYQVCMRESSFNRTLPLFYALLSYGKGETDLFDWMRTMRNLILNTDIGYESLPQVMRDIDAFSSCCKEHNIYDVLRSDEAKDLLKNFNTKQVGEEILKASRPEYKNQMVKLENDRFFSGRICILRRLFSAIGGQEPDCLSEENVTAYTEVLLELFDGTDNGVSDTFDSANADAEHAFLLRRALMSYPPYYFGQWRNGYWSFNSGIGEWRDYINEENSDICAFQSLMKDLLVPAFKHGKRLVDALAEHVKAISENYETDILIEDNDSHRFHFIHHPGVWEYMTTKRCIWNGDSNFDIELKTSNGNNSNRMELRTYCLYLDYLYNKDFISDRKGWTVGIWPRWKTCMYFEFHDTGNKIIAIDAYFYDENCNRESENCYSFDLFIRPTHGDPINKEEEKAFADQDYQQNLVLFSTLIPELMALFVRKADGRLHSKKLYSRKDLKEALSAVMQGVKNSYDKNSK